MGEALIATLRASRVALYFLNLTRFQLHPTQFLED